MTTRDPNRRRTARFFDPEGASTPCCRTCWRLDAVLRRGRVWVEARRTGGMIAHQDRRCRSIIPGSRVEQDVAVAYLSPSRVDVNRRNTLPDNVSRRVAG